MTVEQIDLQVFEYGGTARSGKGTIVADLSQTMPGVATEETGADYRAVTLAMLQEGDIEPEMSPEVIGLTVEARGAGWLTEVVAARKSIVAEHGLEALYTAEVSNTVWKVSPHDVVRGAVKAGFRKRVEAVRDDPATSILVVDGRNLAPLIRKIPGTQMIMRTFVYCDPLEAALRECARNGTSDIGDIGAVAMDLAKRNRHDAGRDTDAVRPDDDAIDYWSNGGSWSEVGSGRPHAATTRFGVGMMAVDTGRQVHFDTGEFRLVSQQPRQAMLVAARLMFDEALTDVRMRQEVGAGMTV